MRAFEIVITRMARTLPNVLATAKKSEMVSHFKLSDKMMRPFHLAGSIAVLFAIIGRINENHTLQASTRIERV